MFITFEGIDGSGKTTILNKLIKTLKNYNFNFILTREPGANDTHKINAQIRKIINSNTNISPMVETTLFSADRRIHLEKIIWPALKNKKVVICDRYFDSTFAYQGSGHKLGFMKMITLQEIITDNFYPHLTFYFDIEIDKAMERLKSRGNKKRLENMNKKFFENVTKGYKQMIAKDSHRFVIIDANQSKKQVYNQVLKEFMQRVIKNIEIKKY